MDVLFLFNLAIAFAIAFVFSLLLRKYLLKTLPSFLIGLAGFSLMLLMPIVFPPIGWSVELHESVKPWTISFGYPPIESTTIYLGEGCLIGNIENCGQGGYFPDGVYRLKEGWFHFSPYELSLKTGDVIHFDGIRNIPHLVYLLLVLLVFIVIFSFLFKRPKGKPFSLKELLLALALIILGCTTLLPPLFVNLTKEDSCFTKYTPSFTPNNVHLTENKQLDIPHCETQFIQFDSKSDFRFEGKKYSFYILERSTTNIIEFLNSSNLEISKLKFIGEDKNKYAIIQVPSDIQSTPQEYVPELIGIKEDTLIVIHSGISKNAEYANTLTSEDMVKIFNGMK